MPPVFDYDLAQLYARALIAIARSDGEITAEEGHVLQQTIDARSAEPLQLDELMFETPLNPEELAAIVQTDPFRGFTMHPVQLAEQLVTDALFVLLSKGHVTQTEGHRIMRFASELGMSDDQVRARIEHASHNPLLAKL
ncbi:MAG: hypothetical protein JWO36_1559 [Myxococcales bacterium]|nr:hypothetical protein [Myxococcales bacterium]